MFSVSAISRAVAAVMMLAAAALPAQPQSMGAAIDAAPGLKGIGLTPVQKRLIYENTSGEKQQKVPEDQVSLGASIPDSVILNEMPVHVKDEVGSLRDFKFAVLPDAHAVLIVDPASRRIMDIVTRDEAKESGAK